MAYQIATTDTGKIFVVLTMNGGKTIAGIVRSCENRADAEKLLQDLSGWAF